jgi:small subunit ribosomal protein S6
MLYELVLLIRPDVSMGQIGDFYKAISTMLESNGGKVEASEYWGFKTLAYPIEKRSKAHYVFLGISSPETYLKEIYHYLKFQSDIMRFLLVRKPEGFVLPTPLFYSPLSEAISGVGPSSPVRSSESASISSVEDDDLGLGLGGENLDADDSVDADLALS